MQAAKPVAPSKPLKFLIRTLRIRLDRLVIADYTDGDPGDQDLQPEHRPHLTRTFPQAKQLLVPDVVRSLYSFGLRHDTEQLLPGDFGRALADAVGAAAHVGDKLKEAGAQDRAIPQGAARQT